MLMIRLQRIGKAKKPTYRFVVSEKNKDPQAGSLEILGHFNPVQKETVFEVKKDRVEYWISKGAQLSNTVHNLFVAHGLISDKKKKKSISISNKRQKKLDEKKQATAGEAA